MEVQKLIGDECYCGGCVGDPICPAPSLPGMEPTPEPVQQSLPGIPYIPGATSFRALGKQVLKDGEHYADARDTDAAERIVRAMNAEVGQSDWAYILAQAR